MTEDEVLALAKDVGDPSPEEERAWAEAARPEFVVQLGRLRAEFRLCRFLRDDARMKALAADVARIQTCVDYLDGLLKGRV